MPWAERRNGVIVNLSRYKSGGVIPEEFLDDNHPDVAAFLAVKPGSDHSNIDNIDNTLKTLALVVADWTGHTPAQLKAAFKAKYDSLNDRATVK